MSQHLLNLTISKVDGPVFSGAVRGVTLPGADGEMTILANHKALISPLKAGTLTIQKEDGTTETHAVTEGTLEISHNQAIVLL
jgi:F-type H+-transporting ATPase subunit epsilon